MKRAPDPPEQVLTAAFDLMHETITDMLTMASMDWTGKMNVPATSSCVLMIPAGLGFECVAPLEKTQVKQPGRDLASVRSVELLDRSAGSCLVSTLAAVAG